MSVRSLALAAAAFVALGTMTFAVSPVSAACAGTGLAAAGPALPAIRVSLAAD